MGWRQYVRALEAEQRRQHKAEQRYQRALERYQKQAAKAAALEHAQQEAAQYENYVEQLVRVHVDCGPRWDWRRISETPPPELPVRSSRHADAAQQVLDQYQPGFLARIFGGAKTRKELELAVQLAHTTDERIHQENVAEHGRAYATWSERVRLAPGVLRLEYAACRQALEHARAFDELQTFQSTVTMTALHNGVATLMCHMDDPDLVPKEELKLTATGKLTTKEMPAGKYWLLLQDHVCSCAISIARETFAVLPVSRVIVNMMLRQLNSSTGHVEPSCVLAVHFTPDKLSKLRFESIDPSDSMKNFHHRMKFKKASGFEIIEASDHDENWVTT